MKQFSVWIDDDKIDGPRHRAVLATLPNYFNIVSGIEECDVLLISPTRMQIRATLLNQDQGIKAVVVSRWGLLEDREFSLLTLLQGDGIIVMPAMHFLPRAIAAIPTVGSPPLLINIVCRIAKQVNNIRLEILTELLALSEYIGQGRVEETEVQITATGTVFLTGCIGGNKNVRLILMESNLQLQNLTADFVSKTTRISMEMGIDVGAKPAQVRFFDSKGETRPIGVYQHSDRLMWADFYSQLSSNIKNPAIQPLDLWDKLKQTKSLVSFTERFIAE